MTPILTFLAGLVLGAVAVYVAIFPPAARKDEYDAPELCPDCIGTGYLRHSGDVHFRAKPDCYEEEG